MAQILTARKLLIRIVVGLLILAAVAAACVLAGAQDVSVKRAFAGPGQKAGENIDYEILVNVRLPRVLLAALVGAALACAGAVYQAILRNPLADPYILGISSGAGLGVIIAVISGAGVGFLAGSGVTIFAFVGASATVWLVWWIGYFAGRSQVTGLLLAGVVVNAFFSAVMMFLTSIVNSEQLRSTIFWLMGTVGDKDWLVLTTGAAGIAVGTIGLFALSHRLNCLSLGPEQAGGLGVDIRKTQAAAFGFAALITAIAVSLSGLIGFVGLIVPHAVRLVFGPDHRQLLPLSAITGAGFLIVADTIARTAFGAEQIPVGIITALCGGPFFLVLLAKFSRRVTWAK